MHSIIAWMQRQITWSLNTFGNGRRTRGISRHIVKELAEIEKVANDATECRKEWIDVIILALDAYWRSGGQPTSLMEDLYTKQEINMNRAWPSPPPPEDEPSEHAK